MIPKPPSPLKKYSFPFQTNVKKYTTTKRYEFAGQIKVKLLTNLILDFIIDFYTILTLG